MSSLRRNCATEGCKAHPLKTLKNWRGQRNGGIDAGETGRAILDMSQISPEERRKKAYYNPQQYANTSPTPEMIATKTGNLNTLHVYAGVPYMHDKSLRPRLAKVATPMLVAWENSDQIVDLDDGRLYAFSIPGAQFDVIEQVGHFPHIEQLALLKQLIESFSEEITAKA